MDSDYHLFESKESEKIDENKKKKKDHSSGYYKFVNQFRHHLKKIENDFSGEEISQLPNHFDLINKYENEFEEQRENCLNCYNALKEQISYIEKVVPNFDVNIFNTFFQNFEEYYSFFQKSQEILRTFSEFNDETQNLFYICKRKNFCVDALKEFVDKISLDYADKVEQYEILNEKFKNLNESYDQLYKIYQESKSEDLKQYENIDNKELMIKQLNDKIKELNIENDRIKKKYNELSKEFELFNMALKAKYVLKSEYEKAVNELKFKMKKYETDNINYKESIHNLKIENEKLIQEKEYLEEQINNHLNNIHTSYDENKQYNLSSLIEENEKEEKDEKEKENENENENNGNENGKEIDNSEEIEDYQGGNDLGDLLMDCEENESDEGHPIENGQVKEDINLTVEQKKDENKDDNNNNKIKKIITKDSIITIEDKKNDLVNNTKKKDNFNKFISLDIGADLKSSLRQAKSKNIRGRKFRHSGSVKIRFEKKPSNNINSAYDIMFKGKQFQFPSRVATKQNFDYFKQFFFLLFQSMKMNSDKIGPFLGYDPEKLYAQCRSEHTPFHKYQKWLEKEVLRKEIIESEKKYEDFATITGIFCTSLI